MKPHSNTWFKDSCLPQSGFTEYRRAIEMISRGLCHVIRVGSDELYEVVVSPAAYKLCALNCRFVVVLGQRSVHDAVPRSTALSSVFAPHALLRTDCAALCTRISPPLSSPALSKLTRSSFFHHPH